MALPWLTVRLMGILFSKKDSVKLLDVGEARATEGNLLHDFAVLPAWQLYNSAVMFFEPVSPS
jgi:hypothetical protein